MKELQVYLNTNEIPYANDNRRRVCMRGDSCVPPKEQVTDWSIRTNLSGTVYCDWTHLWRVLASDCLIQTFSFKATHGETVVD